MFDSDLFITVVLCLLVCWGFLLSYKEIRREQGGRPDFISRQKVLARVLVTTAVLVWFVGWHLGVHYGGTRPTAADEISGRIYSLTNHGHTVYLTLTERVNPLLFGNHCLAITALVCFVSGYFIDRRVRKNIRPVGAG